MASDPRVFFAAERTLLAWVRTGLAVMALGFVVARFGLFLTLVAGSGGGTIPLGHNRISEGLGVALVVLGASVMLGAVVNHLRYIRTLPVADVPRLALPWLATAFAALTAVLGLLLAGYLALA